MLKSQNPDMNYIVIHALRSEDAKDKATKDKKHSINQKNHEEHEKLKQKFLEKTTKCYWLQDRNLLQSIRQRKINCLSGLNRLVQYIKTNNA